MHQPRMIILGTSKLKVLTTVWEEVSLSKSFDPKLTSFLIQIRARMYSILFTRLQADDENYF